MRYVLVLALPLLMLANAGAKANDDIERRLVIKNHQFSPHEIAVPPGQKVKLVIDNQDPTAAEFESDELHREKVVAANRSITVFIGPLDAGSYTFFDDFHRDTTTGTVVAK